MSVYDLGEEEQLTLALQRSLGDERDPELTGGEPGGSARQHHPRPGSSSAAMQATAVPVALSSASRPGSSASTTRFADPELTGPVLAGEQMVVDPGVIGAAGFSYTAYSPPTGDSRHSAMPSSPTAPVWSAHDLFPRSPYAVPLGSQTSHNPPGGTSAENTLPGHTDVDAEVKKALELARQKLFDESEAVLAALCARQPEHRELREVQAAWEAVAMCKQFHATKLTASQCEVVP